MQLDRLLLLSGNDIPFVGGQTSIHPPTMKEIGYVGESKFLKGFDFLNLSKKHLIVKDRSRLENLSNFEIIMSIIGEKGDDSVQSRIDNMKDFLFLIFPGYEMSIQEGGFTFVKAGTNEFFSLNKFNFDEFRDLINQLFNLRIGDNNNLDYNPANQTAREIAEKLQRGREKAARLRGEGKENGEISIYSRYISILVAGTHKSIQDYLNYTPYQLLDEMARFKLREEYTYYLKAALAGAENLGEISDWTKDIYSTN